MKTKEELIKKQKELDELKYMESEIARVDLSGKMPYCKNCAFCYKSYMICELSQETKVANSVCAKTYFQGIENDTRKKSSK